MDDNILKLTTAIDLKGMEKGFEAIKKGTMSTAKAVNKVLNTISGTIKKLFSVYFLKKVFDKLKEYIDSSMKKNREFAAAMKNLRGSMAAAFQPIYETIAPALIYLIQILNYVVQAVGRFIAAISGKSYSQILKNAEALSKQKDALDGVGGAASEAQRQLMGFDEINKLSQEGGAGTGMSFNELDLGSAAGAIDDFAKKLRELILSGQFAEAGDMVAEAANKIINALDLTQIAEKTAGWTNNLTEFANHLMYGIAWNDLGSKFAEGINVLLRKVNAGEIGKLLRLKFSVAIKFLAGFLSTISLRDVGKDLSEGIQGFVGSMKDDMITNFDTVFWENLNKNIEAGFTEFSGVFKTALGDAVTIITAEAPGILSTLGTIGEQIVDMINDALSVMDEEVEFEALDEEGKICTKVGSRWEELGNSIAKGFNSIPWGNILKGSIEAAGSLGLGIVEFITAAIDGIGESWREIGKGIGAGLNTVPWTEILTSTVVDIEKLAIGLGELLSEAIKEIDWDEVGSAIIKGIASIDWNSLAYAIGELCMEMSIAFVELLVGMLDELLGTDLSSKWKDYEEEVRAQFEEDKKAWEQQELARRAAKDMASWSGEEGERYGIDQNGAAREILEDVDGKIKTLVDLVDQGADIGTLVQYFNSLVKAGVSAEEIENTVSSLNNEQAKGKFFALFGEAIEDLKASTDDTTSSVKGLGTQAETTSDTAGTAISGLAENAIRNFNGMRDAAIEAGEAIGWLGGLRLGPIGSTISQGYNPKYNPYYSIPKMAKGGVIPPNREFMAIFGDQRAGNNIETPEALMRQIVREESGSAGGGRVEDLLIELISTVAGIKIGDDVIGRSAARYNRQHGRATGG